MEERVIHTFRFRETEVSHVTIARGEQLILEPDAHFANGVKLKEFCIVPSQPEEVRIRGNVITGLKAGSSTLTISYIVQRGDVNEVKEHIKIRIHVVEPAYYVGEFARLMMPIHILDSHREWLCQALSITSCHQLLAYADKYGFDSLAETGYNSDLNPHIDAFAVRIWLRQSALFQVEGMTRDIAFLAAVAGVRNAEDLARVSQVKLISAFRSLLDGEEISGVTLSDLHLEENDFIALRVGVRTDSENVGGLNLFGERFGDYAQGIIMRVGYAK